MVETIEERRDGHRVKINLPVRFYARGNSEIVATVSENISAEGLRFVHARFLAPQTVVMMEITLLQQMLTAVGKVVWSEPLPHSYRYHLGIEFLEFDFRERNFLQDYIQLHHGGL